MTLWGLPPERPQSSSRAVLIWGFALLAALVISVSAAGLLWHRIGGNKASADRLSSGPLMPALPSSGATKPAPSQSAGPGGGQPSGPAVACPEIRDEESHLAYRCIDNYLLQGRADLLLGLRIFLRHEVEPDWLISEGSGNPKSLVSVTPETTDVAYRRPGQFRQTLANSSPAVPNDQPRAQPIAQPDAQEVRDEVHRRTTRALIAAYGDEPAARTLAEHSRSFGRVAGYEMVTQITINPVFRAAHHLAATSERLWVVGVPTEAGVSIFMLSIPDNRADLWPKAEAIVGTVRVI
jgi:hypothetical protein